MSAPRAASASVVGVVLGIILGVAGDYVLFLGGWTLIPWGIAGVLLGAWAGKEARVIAGSLYGFALCFTFMIAGYTGAAPMVGRLPFFALLGLFGALCGAASATVGSVAWRKLRGSAAP